MSREGRNGECILVRNGRSSPVKTLLCIPTYNAESTAGPFIAALKDQTYHPDLILVIDSSSSDQTATLFKAAGAAVQVIPRSSFNHGGTRQMAVDSIPEADIIMFMTQDAILAHPEALANLVKCLHDDAVGAAYGRQLPRRGAAPIEAHARLFNYPPLSRVKTISDTPRLGIKTAFLSNSFAAFRRIALQSVGGFPPNTIMNEDTYVAAKMIHAGWKIVYCSDTAVYHSHHYSIIQEFRRYFDIGVFHAREPWIRQIFGNAEGEGKQYVASEMRYLAKNNPLLIPSALLRTVMKYAGFKLGSAEKYLSYPFKRLFSMHHYYWR